MADTSLRPQIAAIVEKVDELRPTLQAAGREGDSLRRLPQEAFDAVAATGAFSISAPTAFGGLAANTAECHAVARAIGRGDGSMAWVHASSTLARGSSPSWTSRRSVTCGAPTRA